MQIRRSECDNFSDVLIPVEFVVLHYTALNLDETLAHFAASESRVASHFVIAEDGTLYDLGDFFLGPIRQGAHAGISRLEVDGKYWEGFNYFSIGVEIVNRNGNFIPYHDEQYDTLAKLLAHLKGRFAALGDPKRVLGHEHVAGFRGKIDPGRKFDWERFFRGAYPECESYPLLAPRLDEATLARFAKENGPVSLDSGWARLNSSMEEFIAAS